MTPLTPAARAAIHAQAGRHAHALRDAAIDGLLLRLRRSLQRVLAALARPAPLPAKELRCRS